MEKRPPLENVLDEVPPPASQRCARLLVTQIWMMTARPHTQEVTRYETVNGLKVEIHAETTAGSSGTVATLPDQGVDIYFTQPAQTVQEDVLRSIRKS
jgi:hypothetical protein